MLSDEVLASLKQVPVAPVRSRAASAHPSQGPRDLVDPAYASGDEEETNKSTPSSPIYEPRSPVSPGPAIPQEYLRNESPKDGEGSTVRLLIDFLNSSGQRLNLTKFRHPSVLLLRYLIQRLSFLAVPPAVLLHAVVVLAKQQLSL